MMSPEDQWALALHEAGHAVVARLCGFPVWSVRVFRSGTDARFLCVPITGDKPGSFYYELLTAAAGKVSEKANGVFVQGSDLSSDALDIIAMSILLNRLMGRFALKDRVQRAYGIYTYLTTEPPNTENRVCEDTKEIVLSEGCLPAIRAVASHLITNSEGTISGTEMLDSIIGPYLPQVIGLREPSRPFPTWYLNLVRKSEADLIDQRREEYRAIWRYYAKELQAQDQGSPEF